MCSQLKRKVIFPNYKITYESELNNCEIKIEKVKKLLSELKTRKASGPDELHS